MRCKQCDYRLWNLRSRRCPECGTAFLPSEFEFAVNSVQFCCPHCNQPYYGTGERGHLIPRDFDCVACGTHIDMDEMVLLPAEGIKEEQTETDHMPWLERRQRGRVRAWFSTIGRALVSPARLMRATPPDSSLVQAWWFALLTNFLAVVTGFGPFFLFPLLIGSWVAGRARLGGPAAFGMGAVFAVAVIALATAVWIAVWGAVTHALLLLTGKTASSAGRTYQAICYSSGANIPTGVPCLGLYFGWIWWLISAVIMVKEAQRVHGGRAALATLTPPVVAIGAFVGLYAWLVFAYLPSLPGMRGGAFAATGPASSQAAVQVLLNGVVGYAQTNGGRGPAHAIQLVTNAAVSTSDFIAPGSATVEERVPLDGTTLAGFKLLSTRQEGPVIEAAVKALPANTVAHRLGDFVFTHHGIDLNAPQPGLWLVILSSDPDANPYRPPGQMIIVGCADQSVLRFPASALPSRLAAQNALRAKANLPPLPDPATVTHAKPAVGKP